MANPNQWYGWRPDIPDVRDFRVERPVTAETPPEVRLRHPAPPYDQGALGSCTANAILGQLQYYVPAYTGSRLELYYNERKMEGTIGEDAGAYIRDGMKSLFKTGVVTEAVWPYRVELFAESPRVARHRHRKIKSYARVPRDLAVWDAVLAAGNPVTLGFSVYESFESAAVARSGLVPVPGGREHLLGGHAVLCMGYSRDKRARWCRNSWAADWGLEGYFWLPDEFIVNSDLSDDFWTMGAV